MLIPHVVQTEADKVFVNVLNNQTVSTTAGDVLVWNGTSPDGVRVTQPASATLGLVVGVADSAIAASGYGLAQAYGYNSAVAVTNCTDTALAIGDTLIPVAAVDYLRYEKANLGLDGFFYAAATLATDTTPAETTLGVFIRAL
jgi:hypothetical protein